MNPDKEDHIWIPVSVIEHVQKWPATEGEKYPAHVVTVADWFAQKNNL